MNKYLLLMIAATLLVLTQACLKDKKDLLNGSWERVNVENIDDANAYVWDFNDGELTMKRHPKTDPNAVTITDKGIYVLETNPLGTKLQIIDTSSELYNDRWDVLKLTNEQMIIKLDIEGGVVYKEFVKIF
jgi:hypothetical protein